MFGLWKFSRALDSCVEHILALDGSRMQAELATIMTKHQNYRLKMQLISKQFYCEEVFDDSTSEHPKIRWRYRNYYSDNIAHGQRTHDSDSYRNSPADSGSVSHGDSHNSVDDSHDTQSHTQNDSIKKRINFVSRQVPMKSSVGATADPFECLFGYPAPKEEELHLPDTSTVSPKVQARNRRRAHRRRRTRHQEDSSNLHYVWL